MGIKIMNYYFTGLLVVLFCLLALFVKPAYPDSTQTNTSGSNTELLFYRNIDSFVLLVSIYKTSISW